MKTLLLSIVILYSNILLSQVTYTFTGDGNWTITSNWSDSKLPPEILPAGSTININTTGNNKCVLNTKQVLLPGANLNIMAGANFFISGELSVVPPESQNVIIGTQVWTKVNLDVATYRNGDPIPMVTNREEWNALNTGAYCYVYNSTEFGLTFGKLYNWYAVNDPRGLAPVGWHIPSTSEWETLIDFLGGYEVAGGKMKHTEIWLEPSDGTTNSSGFTALPGGLRKYTGDGGVYFGGQWWSSTPADGDASLANGFTLLNFTNVSGTPGTSEKLNGYSVRCIKD